MRSFVPIFCLTLILATFCIVYSNASKNFFSDIYNCTEKLEKNNFNDSDNKDLLAHMEKTFRKKESHFAPFINHDILEEVQDHIARARVLYELENEDLFRLEICTLKSRLGDVLEEQKASFPNILKR